MQNIPFRPPHLLTAPDFISYCSDHGLIIHAEDLEDLHKQGLLVPVLQLSVGVNKFRKILADFKYMIEDGKAEWRKEWRFVATEDLKKFKYEKLDKATYYHVSSLDRWDPNWLDWYKKRHMVKYPAKEKFKPWPQEPFVGFTKKPVKINDTIFFYERYQFLLLKEIYRLREAYEIPGSQYAKKQVERILKNQVKQFYDFIGFYLEAENYHQKLISVIRKEQQDFFADYNEINRAAKKDWQHYFDGKFQEMLKSQVENILKKYNITIDNIEYWQHWLAGKTLAGNPAYAFAIQRRYVSGLDEKDLIKAEEPNRMIFVLNQILYLLTGEKLTVRQFLGDSQGNRCIICHKFFEPTKKLQYTCGQPECTKKYQNQLKRQNRKTGKYKPR
jgi:hypothetical protein